MTLIAGLVAFPRAQPVFRGSEILITETGYENLSQFVPIEVKDIEALMKR